MALTPKSEQSREEKLAARKSAEADVLMREVDEAVRQDDLARFASTYGKPLIAVIVAGLLAFGGYLWWNGQREADREQHSEELVRALDQVEAGNLDTADAALAELIEQGGPGIQATARMQRAGIALQQGRLAEAVALFDAVANDSSVPEPFRQAATIRSVSANYDNLDPQAVIDRLKPLAVPGNPFFGSAGELVAMAYLDQEKPDLAGPLFAEISRNEQVPETLRSRTRQMAGLLGVDAIDDVAQAIAETADPEAAAQEESVLAQ